MRDLTINQGKSFGAWWVTKCWIDEMIAFMAEQGGFMEYKTSQSAHKDAAKQKVGSRGASQPASRYSSGSDDMLRDNGNGDNGISIPRPMDVTSQAAMNAAAGHDDSGIGIRTPDEDFMNGKYDFVGHEHSHMEPTRLHSGLPQASAS